MTAVPGTKGRLLRDNLDEKNTASQTEDNTGSEGAQITSHTREGEKRSNQLPEAPWKGKPPSNPGSGNITRLAADPSTDSPTEATPKRQETIPLRGNCLKAALIAPQPRPQPLQN